MYRILLVVIINTVKVVLNNEQNKYASFQNFK